METVIHVTGAGVVSAVGCGQGETLDALRHGRSGIAPVRFLHTEEQAFPVGEVKLSDAEMAERCGAQGPGWNPPDRWNHGRRHGPDGTDFSGVFAPA